MQSIVKGETTVNRIATPELDTSTTEDGTGAEPMGANRNGVRKDGAPAAGNSTESAAKQTPQSKDSTAEAPEDVASEQSTLERAEKLADRIGLVIGVAAAVAGRQVIRFAARTREVIEDCWAEAQSIRRGDKQERPLDDDMNQS
jgi:hypothetical protein